MRSRTLAVQSLVFGRVIDGVTGEAPRARVDLRLVDRDDPDLGEFGLGNRLTADGRYSFYGDPDRAFTRIAVRQYRGRVEASADHFVAAGRDFDVGPLADQPASVSIPIPDYDSADVNLFTATLPLELPDLTINPIPVALEGRVIDRITGEGIADAEIEIDPFGPVGTTGSDGRFTLVALPVEVAVTLTVSAAGFEHESHTHVITYGRARNSLVVPLQQEDP